MKLKNKSKVHYGKSSIIISELIGRAYNNPLGEYPFKLRSSDFTSDRPAKILDIGSGRGRAAIYTAKTFSADVTAIEPSEEMAVFSKNLIKDSLQEKKIRVLCEDFISVSLAPKSFDIAMSFDVISYFKDKEKVLNKVLSLLFKSGKFIFSDYFCSDSNDPLIQQLTKTWGIVTPGIINYYPNELAKLGFKVDYFEDTTSKYFNHWSEVKELVIARWDELIDATSDIDTEEYLIAIESILSAVDSKKFGHLLCVATVPPHESNFI